MDRVESGRGYRDGEDPNDLLVRDYNHDSNQHHGGDDDRERDDENPTNFNKPANQNIDSNSRKMMEGNFNEGLKAAQATGTFQTGEATRHGGPRNDRVFGNLAGQGGHHQLQPGYSDAEPSVNDDASIADNQQLEAAQAALSQEAELSLVPDSDDQESPRPSPPRYT